MGNGMDRRFLPPRKSSLRLRDYDYSQPGYYFVTVCTKVRHQNVLCAIRNVGAAALGGPVVELTQEGKIVDQLILNINLVYDGLIAVDTYCIMPDHIHLILWFRGQEIGPPRAAAPTDLPAVINALKGLAVKKIGYPIWQRGYYDHIIRSEQDLNEIRRYIQENPIKWGIQ